MNVSDVCAANAKFYLKSENDLQSADWPVISFSGERPKFSKKYQTGRDIVITIGTKGADTPEGNRGRLLVLAKIDAASHYKTSNFVSEDQQKRFSRKWDSCFPIQQLYYFEPKLDAADIFPETYGAKYARGNFTPVVDSDLEQLLCAQILEDASWFDNERSYLRASTTETPSDGLDFECRRLAALICTRTQRGGKSRDISYPNREAENMRAENIKEMFENQNGQCALCEGLIEPGGGNKLLQPSVDRLDSKNPYYDRSNSKLTHLGCNLAKSDASLMDWNEYLGCIRGKRNANS